jgi:hypothetical protein
MTNRLALCCALLALVGCGNADDAPDPSATPAAAGSAGAGGDAAGAAGAGGAGGAGGAAGPGGGAGGENQPPTFSAPAAAVREGESVDVPVELGDPEGDPITVSAASSDLATVSLTGKSLHVSALYGEGDAVELTVSDGKHDVAASLPVAVERLAWGATWNLKTAGLAEREHPSLVVDPARDRVIVYGGSGYKPQGTALGDTWSVSLLDGAATELAPSGDVPPASASRRASAIPGTTKAYLWGGYSTTGNLNDLFLVDVAGEQPVFTAIPQKNAPKVRSLHLFAYDDETGTFVVFGGAGSTPLADMWTGSLADGTVTWTKVTSDAPPGKRYGFFYAQDSKRGVVYLFSGATGFSPLAPARDLWRLDLRASPPAFTLVAEGMAVPEGRRNGATAYDEATERMIIFGGTPDGMVSAPGLWLFDAREGQGRFWNLDRAGAPPLRSSGVGFVNPKTGAMYVGFGNDKGIYADLTPLGFSSAGN